MSSARVTPERSRMRRTTGYASGWTPEASKGSSPPRIRRKPAHCSNALGPRRGTFSSALRLRNGPVLSRWVTIASANDSETPDTRASSGTDAVFRSTPTAFTASSTTASRLRASVPGRDVVLVLPNADRLRLDLHQFGQRILKPPRNRHRTAQGHVERWQLVGRIAQRPSTPTRRPHSPWPSREPGRRRPGCRR